MAHSFSTFAIAWTFHLPKVTQPTLPFLQRANFKGGGGWPINIILTLNMVVYFPVIAETILTFQEV